MLTPAGGAVCLPEANPPDCVSWGNFAGALPFPGAGTPAPAIPEGLSLTRTTARGCALGLDKADDSNDSAADFSLGSPTPRPNSAPPLGRACIPCGGRDATLVGTEAKDVLRGTRGRDVIAGLSGADTIRGRGGDDVLCGGIGKDVLRGGPAATGSSAAAAATPARAERARTPAAPARPSASRCSVCSRAPDLRGSAGPRRVREGEE
jgi:hypothetical protein